MKKRFLISFDTKKIPYIQTDILIIGSGIAGLCAAIEAAKYAKVLIITKDKLSESNTEQAQGGIAVVLSEGDSFERHFEDALRVGSGLCKDNNLDYSPVRLLAQMNIFEFLTPPLWKIFLKGYNA